VRVAQWSTSSIIAGLLALLLAAALFSATTFLAIVIIARRTLGGIWGFGIDFPRGHTVALLFWLLAAAIFGAGFFWELHRLTK